MLSADALVEARQYFKETDILVTGGATGVGRALVGFLLENGVRHVYAGSTNPEHFRISMGMWQKKGLDVSRVSLFQADVTDKKQLQTAAQKIKSDGGYITDEVYSHAGGMESFSGKLFENHLNPIVVDYTLDTPLEELSPQDQETVHQRLIVMRQDLQVWTKEALPRAIDVNYGGTFNTMGVLDDTFPNRSSKNRVFMNSTWGYLSGIPGVEIPLLYRPVDLSKAMVRDRLPTMDGNNWELVASLIRQTQVGKMFEYNLLNLTSKEQRNAIRSSSVGIDDVVLAIAGILYAKPAARVQFLSTTDSQVVQAETLDYTTAMYTMPYLY